MPETQGAFGQVLRDELALIKQRRQMIYELARSDKRLQDRLFTDHNPIEAATEQTEGEAEAAPPAAERPAVNEDDLLTRARTEALQANLAGLALSGGGIRSATFAVGVLQGLASLKLLRFFDLLSTVSGGGYAGGWLAAWIAREGDPLNVERQLDVNRVGQSEAIRLAGNGTDQVTQVVDEEAEPIRHLRRHSSYLNPRSGLFSTDTWTIVAIYMRNILINFLLLVPLAMTVVLLLRWVIDAFHQFANADQDQVVYKLAIGKLVIGAVKIPALGIFGLGALLTVAAFLVNAVAIWCIRNRKRGWHLTSGAAVNYLVVLPLFLATVLISMTYQPFLDTAREAVAAYGQREGMDTGYLGWPNMIAHMAAFGGLMFLVSVLVLILGWLTRNDRERNRDVRARLSRAFRLPIAAATAGATAGFLVTLIETLLRPTLAERLPWLRALAGPPLFLVAIVVAISALVSLIGPAGTESEREWWGRLAAMLLRWALAWSLVVVVVVYGPAVLLGSHQLIAAALGCGWFVTTVSGVLAGRSGATTGAGGSRLLETIAVVAPPVFLIGLLALAATVATLVLSGAGAVAAIHVQDTFGRALAVYFQSIRAVPGDSIVAGLMASAAASLLATTLVNVNIFSLHAMYANRLTRAFLGASRPRDEWLDRWDKSARDQRVLAGAPTGAVGPTRDPNPVTGFDPDDDLELGALKIGAGRSGRVRYWGPQMVFNTALNLVGGDELAWRDRKAESFMLTPVYCGARSTGYAPTPADTGMVMTVGRAIAIGAAVDPNMNYHQSSSVTALLTVFNARLGVWIRNPNPDRWPWWQSGKRQQAKNDHWDAGNATYGGLLVKELMGRTNEKGSYVHISDGGHFDNLGVYELVKRRCRYIVAVDATENRQATSDKLGTLVRLCRVDLGVRVQLDTAPLEIEGPEGSSRAHVVVGRVRYDDVDNGQTPGILVYVRSSMTGDEPTDVQQYANLHAEFPRQRTLTDQSFDEDQFESYRTLGDHVARNVFEVGALAIFADSGGDGDQWWRDAREGAQIAFGQGHRKIFGALRNRWTEPPPGEDTRYLQSTKEWKALQHDLRTEPVLARLARDFYPELAIFDETDEGKQRRAELHTFEEALQLMEDAWHGLGLKGHDDAPIGRAWLNVFSRMAGSETCRLLWPLLRAECSPEFVRFCEQRLRLYPDQLRLVPIKDDHPAIAALGAEFAREWPRQLGRSLGKGTETLAEAGRRYLWDRRNTALPLGTDRDGREARAAWLIVQGPVGYEPTRESGFGFPVGILIVFPADRFQPAGVEEGSQQSGGRDFDLLLWIRRAHRSSTIGEKILRRAIRRLIGPLGDPPSRLVVRYPPTQGSGSEDQDRVRWLGFFSLFGFTPAAPPRANQELVLSRHFDKNQKTTTS